jgi:hypothetical protein
MSFSWCYFGLCSLLTFCTCCSFWCISCREIKRILRTKLEELLKPELLWSPRSLHLGHVVWSPAYDYNTYSGKRLACHVIHCVCTHLYLLLLWATVTYALVLQVNTLVTLCMLMVRWKRAELKHRAREARSKQEWRCPALELLICFAVGN